VWGTNQTSRRVLAATITAGALLLPGCTIGEPDDDITAPSFAPVSPEPSQSEAAPSSEEPSTEATVAAPPLPPEATEQTPEGAVAFTEWWFDTLNYATQTGDTDALRAASDPECGTCQSYIEEIESAYEAGGRIDGGLFEVQVEPAGALEDLGVRVPVFAASQPTQIYDGAGQVVTEYAAEVAVITFTALLVEGGWAAGGLAS
jgi:hypothetical protein